MRQEGAFKRERAMAYSLTQKQWRSNLTPNARTIHSIPYLKSREFDKNCWGWSWLERWMAARPWETRLMEQQSQAEIAEATPPPKSCITCPANKHLKSPETTTVKVRKNNVTTRISAKPPHTGNRSSGSPCSESRFLDESSASSSICTSTTPASANTGLASDETGSNSNKTNKGKPSYMNMTESTKAKRRTNRVYRQSMDEFQFMKNSGLFSNGDLKSNAALDPPSVNFSKPLGVQGRMEKPRGKENRL